MAAVFQIAAQFLRGGSERLKGVSKTGGDNIKIKFQLIQAAFLILIKFECTKFIFMILQMLMGVLAAFILC
jgi:hypothetical protein